MMLSTMEREVSALLAMKCLMVVPTPWAWAPFTSAAPITPDTRGSSEKYSKLRPLRGSR
ncbi:hypothetical protein D3C85_1706010 [compost metagenome]